MQGRGAGSGAGDMDMPELESSSDSEDDEDNDMVRRSTFFHLFYIVHRCTRRSRACACTASPQGTTGTANGEYMDPGPGPPKKHEVFWQYRDQKRAEGKGPCATYKGFREAQLPGWILCTPPGTPSPAGPCLTSRPTATPCLQASRRRRSLSPGVSSSSTELMVRVYTGEK